MIQPMHDMRKIGLLRFQCLANFNGFTHRQMRRMSRIKTKRIDHKHFDSVQQVLLRLAAVF